MCGSWVSLNVAEIIIHYVVTIIIIIIVVEKLTPELVEIWCLPYLFYIILKRWKLKIKPDII